MSSSFERGTNRDAGAMAICLLALFYFSLTTFYFTYFFAGRVVHYGIPDVWKLWHIRVALRVLLHWAGWLGVVGILAGRAWGRSVLLVATGGIFGLSLIVLLKRFFQYGAMASGKISLLQLLEGLYDTSPYQIFSFFLMAFFFIFFRAAENTNAR